MVSYFWLVGDVGNSVEELYINGSEDGNEVTNADDDLDYTRTEWAIGATVAAASDFDGRIAELYFAPGQYLDFSIAANRRKFITSSLKPADLGPHGENPLFGTKPILYMPYPTEYNYGTGGNFAKVGTPAQSGGPVKRKGSTFKFDL